jgi:predicted lactoylglutathione lyase
MVHRALAMGARPSNEPMDQGPMYGWSYEELDVHLWEVIYMEPSAVRPNPDYP